MFLGTSPIRPKLPTNTFSAVSAIWLAAAGGGIVQVKVSF